MVLSIFSFSLLLSWGLLGMATRLGSGFSTSPSDDDWTCAAVPTLLFSMPGVLVYFFQAYLRGRVFLEWGVC